MLYGDARARKTGARHRTPPAPPLSRYLRPLRSAAMGGRRLILEGAVRTAP